MQQCIDKDCALAKTARVDACRRMLCIQLATAAASLQCFTTGQGLNITRPYLDAQRESALKAETVITHTQPMHHGYCDHMATTCSIGSFDQQLQGGSSRSLQH